MAKTSLETICEDLFIELFRAHPLLKGRTIVPFDRKQTAAADCIVVEATQGNHRLDGPKGFDVSVTADYRSATNDPSQNDMVADALVSAVYNPVVTPLSVSRFTFIHILDEMTSARSNSKNLRKRSRTFPVIAVQKD